MGRACVGIGLAALVGGCARPAEPPAAPSAPAPAIRAPEREPTIDPGVGDDSAGSGPSHCLVEFPRPRYGLGPEVDATKLAADCDCEPATLISMEAAQCIARGMGLDEARKPLRASLRIGRVRPRQVIWTVHSVDAVHASGASSGTTVGLDARSGEIVEIGKWRASSTSFESGGN